AAAATAGRRRRAADARRQRLRGADPRAPAASLAHRRPQPARAAGGGRMRILYHHRTRGRDVEGVHIRGVVGALRALGHEVSVLSFPGADPEQEPAAGAARTKQRGGLGAIVSRMPGVLFEALELGYNLVTLVRMPSAFARLRPQLVYERYSLFLFSTVWLARRRGASSAGACARRPDWCSSPAGSSSRPWPPTATSRPRWSRRTRPTSPASIPGATTANACAPSAAWRDAWCAATSARSCTGTASTASSRRSPHGWPRRRSWCCCWSAKPHTTR